MNNIPKEDGCYWVRWNPNINGAHRQPFVVEIEHKKIGPNIDESIWMFGESFPLSDDLIGDLVWGPKINPPLQMIVL